MNFVSCKPIDWSDEVLGLIFVWKGNLITFILVAWMLYMSALVAMRWFRGKYLREYEEKEEIYRFGGRRTSGIIITYYVSKLASYIAFFDFTRAVYHEGVGGAYYNTIASCLAITLMAPLAVELKTKAPGARTFLQVIRIRFGTIIHCLFCFCAVVVNCSMIFEIGSRSLTALMATSSNTSKEPVLAVVFFTIAITLTYSGISSLFSCSYISTTFLTLAVVLVGGATFFNSSLYPLGDCNRIILLTTCQSVENGTEPVFSFRSVPAILDALEEFGTYMVFLLLNQSYWQGVLNSEQETGGFNLLAGGIFFYPMGAVFGTACGLGYLALNMSYGQVLLPPYLENLGLMAFTITDFLFGSFGTLLLHTVIACSFAATTCSEVMSISTIFVVDIYMTYIRPFKKYTEMNVCILCGLKRVKTSENAERCRCKSMAACPGCQQDDKDKEFTRRGIDFWARCPTHADYRRYIEHMKEIRTYTVYIVLGAFLAGAMIFDYEEIAVVEIRHCVATLCAPILGSLYFAFYWPRVTTNAVALGILVGALSGVGVIAASFYVNSQWMKFAIVGNILLGSIVTAVYTLLSTRPLNEEEKTEVWEKTRSIDDPLQPWSETCAKDMGIRNAHLLQEGRPRLDDVQRAFSFSSRTLNYSIILLIFLYVGFLPGCVLIPSFISVKYFQILVFVLLIWASTSMMFLFITPPIFGIEKARRIKRENAASQTGNYYTAVTQSRWSALSKLWTQIKSTKLTNPKLWSLTKKDN